MSLYWLKKYNANVLNGDCQEEFEPIETESLLNAIQHGKLNQGQIDFLKSRVGSDTCKRCFCGQHN
ncbi:MAG: hypothetical protein ACE1Y0_00965 [Nitrosopumilaceae archaeon]